ncbi:MAG: hypothetical protein E7382_05645 [Clostridiales bacterium]|nr:hypothetical protein [Clostridiales bacterium]
MFVTKNQFYVFVACLAFGCAVGIIFGFSSIIKKRVKNILICAIGDFFAFIITAFLFLIYSFNMHFPSLRVYMFIGVYLGIYIYFKSFNIILAKCAEKIYNIRVKNKIKVKNDKRKKKKAKSFNNGRGNTLASDYSGCCDLATSKHLDKKKPH